LEDLLMKAVFYVVLLVVAAGIIGVLAFAAKT
jgi:hypothetical protein